MYWLYRVPNTKGSYKYITVVMHISPNHFIHTYSIEYSTFVMVLNDARGGALVCIFSVLLRRACLCVYVCVCV